MATSAILGLYPDVDGAAKAGDALTKSGFASDDWEVLSGPPYPHGAFGEHASHHRLYVFPFFGGACGFAVGVLLTVGTQLAQPLVTGGKPLLSLPPMINVIYEGTMLGAIIFTVLGVIFESRLPRRYIGLYDPRITADAIGILVSASEERLGDAERALRSAGAIDIVSKRS